MATIDEIMTKRVEFIGPDALLREAAKKMKDIDCGMLPVCDGDRIIGTITDRDITINAVAVGKDPGNTKVRDAMHKGVVCAYVDQDIDEAARLMEEKKVRRLPILDRNNRLCGIVAQRDLALHASAETTGEVVEGISR